MSSRAEREQVERRGVILEQAVTGGGAVLRRQAARHSRSESEAEEALQEASVDFLRTYDGPAGLDAVRWLQVAIRHRAWDLKDRRRLQMSLSAGCPDIPERDLAASGVDPEGVLERAEAVERSFAALAQLKPDERTALIMFGLGFSYREIGERRGWTYTKVNRCIKEGRAALRALLG
jgi:RNA polymerase sigma factor (sigma-70 family)